MNKPAYLQCYWMTGFVLIFVASGLNALSLNYGNLLLLSSSSSITMIFNLLMARYFLKEFFNWIYDTIAILLIIAGSGMCLAFSKNQGNDSTLTNQALVQLFLAPQAIAYILTIYSFVTFSYFYNLYLVKIVWEFYRSLQLKWEEATSEGQRLGIQCSRFCKNMSVAQPITASILAGGPRRMSTA